VLSINRECKRIVEGLRAPGHSSEQMLEIIAFRRADGREVDLVIESSGTLSTTTRRRW